MIVRLLLATTLATTLAATPAAPAAPVPPPVDGPAVAAVVERYLRDTGLPGAAVAVTRGRQVVHAAGHGRTATGEPVTARTPMPTASLSKSVTALAVLQLVEAGRLRLDDPVRAHLPEFEMADPRAAAVTVRQLLDHTSGMSDRTFPSASRPQPATLRESVAQLRTAALAAAPGTRWEYHNPNHQVAARLVEVVDGRPFDAYLRERVFEPLGMRDSRGIATDRDLPPGPTGHVRVLGIAVPAREPAAFGAGSGGVLSTAHDLAAWLIAQNGGGTGPDGRSVASPTTIATSHAPSSPASGSYALGWSVGTTDGGAPAVSHGGDLVTATAHQVLLPASGHGVAVLANTGPVDGDARALAEQLVALVEGRPLPAAGSPAAAVDAALLGLAAAVALLAVRGVRRRATWAARRSPVGTALGVLPLLAPAVLLVAVHRVLGALHRGRDVTWVQAAHLHPVLVLLLAVAAAGGLAVAGARLAAARR